MQVELIDAGLPTEKVDEIIGKQAFSLENVTASAFPQSPIAG
jgi:hypothetical protein